jgi:hypothetical protein
MGGHKVDEVNSKFFTTHDQREKDEVAKTWAYIGRFMWGFAMIENEVDVILSPLFNLHSVGYLLLIGNVDLRKKLKFLEIGLKHQKIDVKEVMSMIHHLHDVRNFLAHSRFVPDYGNLGHDAGEGIEFEYVSSSGKLEHRDFPVPPDSFASFGSFLPYSKLDSYDAKMVEIENKLKKISDTLSPITDVSADMARDIEMIIEGSENVFRFPTIPTPRKDG